MATRLTSSRVYGHLWGTAETAALFEEAAMLQRWLDILVALARAQERFGIVPAGTADRLAVVGIDALDLDRLAAETRRTSHSTLGLIRELRRVLPEEAREHVYVGATVQDLTDTWFGTLLRDVGSIVWRDLRACEATLLDLAERHRDTPMAGRTHGQPGAPITFGLKAASWADEVRRHVARLREGRDRWCVGQLAGAVGALAFYGDAGPALRARFCAEVGLGDPGISWLTARDRVAEFGHVLAMVCATLARIGTEVYELARPEIGELREPARPGAVSSITMPHKRNPEAGEHLDTLARLARASAHVLLEGMVGGHERDGRSWKAEWVALPEVCQLTATALGIGRELLDGLEVDPAAMAATLRRFGDLDGERVLAGLTARLGRHRAQETMHELLRGDAADAGGDPDGGGAAPGAVVAADGVAAGGAGGDPLAALVESGVATAEELAAWRGGDALAISGAMVDGVLGRAAAARAAEPERWWP